MPSSVRSARSLYSPSLGGTLLSAFLSYLCPLPMTSQLQMAPPPMFLQSLLVECSARLGHTPAVEGQYVRGAARAAYFIGILLAHHLLKEP